MDIKGAYHTVSKACHPDKSRRPEAAKYMQDINNAYDALKTQEDRMHYEECGGNMPGRMTRFSLLTNGQEICNLYDQEFFKNLDKMENSFLYTVNPLT